jgi:single-strand DNA-binding protein
VWGKQAEFCEKYLNQGKQVLIEGKLRTRKWQDKEGNNRYTTEVHAQNIILLGKRDEAGESTDYMESREPSEFPPDKEEKTPEIDVGDDEVPF